MAQPDNVAPAQSVREEEFVSYPSLPEGITLTPVDHIPKRTYKKRRPRTEPQEDLRGLFG